MIWRCPKSRGELIFFADGEVGGGEPFYLCPQSRMRYRVAEGVPVFLVDEAEELAIAEVDRLVARARQLGLRVP